MMSHSGTTSTRLLLATRNRGKLAEFRALFAAVPALELVGLDDVPPLPEVVEDGDSFQANAAKKALGVAQGSGLLVLADDSGLEVDAIEGAPGVFSARFAGPGATDSDNNRKLLDLLKDVADEKRTARFRCVLALAQPAASPPGAAIVRLEHGVCEGRILFDPKGSHGFGYDPVFLPDGHERSMAELTAEEKNRISHRARAARAMRDFLASFLARRES
jgi:XTP/dITP diphosphohydrolase